MKTKWTLLVELEPGLIFTDKTSLQLYPVNYESIQWDSDIALLIE